MINLPKSESILFKFEINSGKFSTCSKTCQSVIISNFWFENFDTSSSSTIPFSAAKFLASLSGSVPKTFQVLFLQTFKNSPVPAPTSKIFFSGLDKLF